MQIMYGTWIGLCLCALLALMKKLDKIIEDSKKQHDLEVIKELEKQFEDK